MKKKEKQFEAELKKIDSTRIIVYNDGFQLLYNYNNTPKATTVKLDKDVAVAFNSFMTSMKREAARLSYLVQNPSQIQTEDYD